MEPTAKGLTLDLLGTLRRGSAMPVGALVEAGELFGIAGNNIRVCVARLLAAGHIVRDERGRYRLGDGAITRRVRSWRDIDLRTKRWNGGWIGVHTAAGRIGASHKANAALQLLGLGQLRPSLWLRPDNLSQSVGGLRDELAGLEFPEGNLVFGLHELDADSEAQARRLWDVDALCHGHRGVQGELVASAARLRDLPTGKAMVESFLLGGRAVRRLVRDPLLPEVICPSAERKALLETLRRYDRVGRLAWADFLRRFHIPYLRTPVDGRTDSFSVNAPLAAAAGP